MTVTMPKPTPAPLVSEAPDAQPQVPTSSATVPLVSEAPDAQPQVPTSSATVPVVSEAPDAQPQVPTSSATVPVVSEAPDAQPQAPSSSAPAPSPTTPFPVVPPSASGMGGKAARPISGNTACAEEGSLAITLENGILKDHKGRTGYIAANYQFQFDGPPQAGAIITAGFSTCNNGSLALGGSNVFYKCLSGEFYNLYDRSWAAQCSPVTINTIMFKKC